MPRSKYTPQQKTEALDLYVEHGPAEASKRTGIPSSTIRTWANRADLGQSHSENTRAAVEQAKLSNERRRALLASSLLDDAERLRRSLWEPCTLHNFGGKDNTYNSREISQPTFRDQQAILTSVAIAVDKSMKLELHDQDDSSGLAAVDAWLRDVIHGEGTAA